MAPISRGEAEFFAWNGEGQASSEGPEKCMVGEVPLEEAGRRQGEAGAGHPLDSHANLKTIAVAGTTDRLSALSPRAGIPVHAILFRPGYSPCSPRCCIIAWIRTD